MKDDLEYNYIAPSICWVAGRMYVDRCAVMSTQPAMGRIELPSVEIKVMKGQTTRKRKTKASELRG